MQRRQGIQNGTFGAQSRPIRQHTTCTVRVREEFTTTVVDRDTGEIFSDMQGGYFTQGFVPRRATQAPDTTLRKEKHLLQGTHAVVTRAPSRHVPFHLTYMRKVQGEWVYDIGFIEAKSNADGSVIEFRSIVPMRDVYVLIS